MGRVVILVPYFGSWPEWFDLFLQSCSHNPTWDWIFFTDCDPPERHPSNVRFERVSFQKMQERFSDRLAVDIRLDRPYKLCDLRPTYGKVFESYTRGYEMWGFGDIDVVYGDLDKFVGHLLPHLDVVSFHKEFVSGHLALFRNNDGLRNLYSGIPGFFGRVRRADYQFLDELVFAGESGHSGRQPSFPGEHRWRIHRKEYGTTPYSPYRRWVNGSGGTPLEWRWEAGEIRSNDAARFELPYLHFLHFKHPNSYTVRQGLTSWRQLRQIVYGTQRELARGCLIGHAGIRPIDGGLYAPRFRSRHGHVYFRSMLGKRLWQARVRCELVLSPILKRFARLRHHT